METIATIATVIIALHIMFAGGKQTQAPPPNAGTGDQKGEYPKRKA